MKTILFFFLSILSYPIYGQELIPFVNLQVDNKKFSGGVVDLDDDSVYILTCYHSFRGYNNPTTKIYFYDDNSNCIDQSDGKLFKYDQYADLSLIKVKRQKYVYWQIPIKKVEISLPCSIFSYGGGDTFYRYDTRITKTQQTVWTINNNKRFVDQYVGTGLIYGRSGSVYMNTEIGLVCLGVEIDEKGNSYFVQRNEIVKFLEND